MFRTIALTVALALAPAVSFAFSPVETPMLRPEVEAGALPPVIERAPADPLIVDLEAKGRELGRHGGTMNKLIAKTKNIRYMTVWGYARLVGFNENFELKPDLLKSVDVKDEQIFTFTLREGHRWSDGHPFTTEDFRYWWEDVANNEKLSPTGPPAMMMVGHEAPIVEVLSETEIRYTFDAPNPAFLSALAAARPPFIYRPAHYMKQFHAKYSPEEEFAKMLKKKKIRNWAQLHNRLDNLYKNDNPELPTLQPWVNTTGRRGQHFVMKRNPFFHRFDTNGRQLPYIDNVDLRVAASSLTPAKAMIGEVDLQAKGLDFMSVPLLKQGAEQGDYNVRLWPSGSSSHIALYPNLNYEDKVWRKILRNKRFRWAMSMGIDRRIINRTLYFGLSREIGNSVLESSPLYSEEYANAWSKYDPEAANALLDEIGLTERRGDGLRLLPDGRPLEVIVETAGERREEVDALQLIGETWKEIGIGLIVRPSDRDILRNRSYAGRTMMTVWSGWDLGVPTGAMSPQELAPTQQSTLIWPKWGQNFETRGKMGERPKGRPVNKLLELYYGWLSGTDHDGRHKDRAEIWEEMLNIHADQQYIIGVVAQAPQPVVVSNRLRNVPERVVYAWDPGGHFGMHRMDEFWFTDAPLDTAEVQ